MAKTRYGIISDTHENPGIVPVALQVLQNLGIDKLIVNGDIGAGQDHMVYTLSQVGKTGIESYVQPGSHERLNDFESVMEFVSNGYKNVVSAFDVPKIEAGDHEVVFLPGSDFLCGGQYKLLRREDVESGFYKTPQGNLRVVNMNDLTKLVNNPEESIVVSHVPRKFDNVDKGVDMAYFAENLRNGSVIPGLVFEAMIRESRKCFRTGAGKNGFR